MFPNSINEAFVVEPEEKAVDVFVGLAADGRRLVEVLTKDVRAIGDGVHVVKADG
ncbi:unannotated protein [freshwater metagenome]|uniref:Unannotated protein n=1 Tax=freshwater metagenome TaxID=449393 RepID=A0A6J7K4B6_9ZZZZ